MSGFGMRISATSAAIAAWLLMVVGGLVRVTKSGLGCPDWPLCSGRLTPLAHEAPIIEYSHRALASITSVLVICTLILAWRTCRRRRDIVWLATGTAVMLPLQAGLGAVVVLYELPGWIVAVHFVLGMVFMGLAVGTAVRAWIPDESIERRQWAWFGLALAFVLMVSGAAVVGSSADQSCGHHWPLCGTSLMPHAGLATVQFTHRALALLMLVFATALVIVATRSQHFRSRFALLLVSLISLQAAAGAVLVSINENSSMHQAFEIAHIGGASAVWAMLVVMATVRTRRTKP